MELVTLLLVKIFGHVATLVLIILRTHSTPASVLFCQLLTPISQRPNDTGAAQSTAGEGCYNALVDVGPDAGPFNASL